MFYILKHKTYKDSYVGIMTSSNEGSDFCNNTTVEFDFGHEVPYLFTTLDLIQKVLSEEYKCEWYNSSIENPSITMYVKDEIIKNYEIIKLIPET